MSKFLLSALVILALQPLPALAQTETQYGFPVTETPAGDLPCHMVTSNRNTLNLGRLCGGVPSTNYSGSNTGVGTARISNTGNFSSGSNDGPCQFPWQRDSRGRLCGDRAASERPGGNSRASGYSSNSGSQRRSNSNIQLTPLAPTPDLTIRMNPLTPLAPSRDLTIRSTFGNSSGSSSGRCNSPNDLDANGNRCGNRASSVRPGGRR